MRWAVALGVLACALAIAAIAPGCSNDSTSAPASPRVTVLAASSLKEVLEELSPATRYNFAGSDQLAFQIEQGAPADVFASASAKYTSALHARGLVGRPRVFATNRLVVVVPASNPAGIRSVDDLANRGVKLVIGDPEVPIGAYSRQVLARLGLNAALANVVSNEQDVKAVVAKVALGEADAGLVYRTDVRAAGSRVSAITIPAAGQTPVEYEVAVLRDAPDRAAAEAFVRVLLGDEGRAALRRHGFGLSAPG